MTDKRYELETIKQVLEVVNQDNLQNFLEDFGLWLNLRSQVKDMLIKHPEAKVQTKDVFIWIDDGKHDMNIKVTGVSR